MRKRIIGFDFARGLAILGMIMVNFKMVMATHGQESKILYKLLELLSGKAAALFVVLAGVGITLMYKSIKLRYDNNAIQVFRKTMLKRSLFLFVIGMSYYFLWTADILHYYGFYLAIGAFFITASRKWLLALSFFIIIGYTISVFLFNYEKDWDFTILEYTDFFTIGGFFRNMFFNGFHPVFPWIVFLFTGIWFGRCDFSNINTRKRILITSLAIFVITQLVSQGLIFVSLNDGMTPAEIEEVYGIFGTTPMPPLLLYMVSGCSFSILTIIISIIFTERFYKNSLVNMVVNTGQLALTNYFMHVIIGMLGIWFVVGKLEYAFSVEFVFIYGILFCIVTVIFSHFWKMLYSKGPLEILMRKITG